MWMSKCILAAFVILLSSTCVAGSKCRGSMPTARANFHEKILYSPGYPQNYETSDNCTWVIIAEFGGTNNVIQLATIHIDINDYKKDCSTDYIEVYEGELTQKKLLSKWCGNETQIIKVPRAITLRFRSDEQITGKGFAISYSLINDNTVDCKVGQKGNITVGTAPVIEYFQGKASVPSCEWHIQSEEPDKKLLIELIKPSTVSCKDGSFHFYDGGNTSSHISYEYCSTSAPFSLMYLSSNKAVIIFTNKRNAEPDRLILKISASSLLYECTASNIPTIGVGGALVILALPLSFGKNTMNTSCSVRLWGEDGNKTLRLDVMGTRQEKAHCSMDVVTVKNNATNQPIEKSCNRGKNPVYRQNTTDGMVVSSPFEVYLRAAVVDAQCDGTIVRKIAYDSPVQEEMVPEQGHYSRLDYCKFLFQGEKGKIIYLALTWKSTVSEGNPDTKESVCLGDFVNIYNGDSDGSPVLFSSCWPRNHSDGFVNVTVLSSQNSLLVVLDANTTDGESVKVKFHSIPGDAHCSKPKDISVNRMHQKLTLPNYPNSFLMNQFCVYYLVSQMPKDVIVVTVLAAQLGDKCKNNLIVYEGNYTGDNGAKVVGSVSGCGSDSSIFRIANSTATLIAESEDDPSDGRWTVEVYTEETKTNSAGSINLSITVTLMLLVAQRQT